MSFAHFMDKWRWVPGYPDAHIFLDPHVGWWKIPLLLVKPCSFWDETTIFLQVKSGETTIKMWMKSSLLVKSPWHPMAPLLITILVKSVVFVAGPAISEIEEIVKDTALSLIGVESLENDEPLMDAGAPACPARSRAPTPNGGLLGCHTDS